MPNKKLTLESLRQAQATMEKLKLPQLYIVQIEGGTFLNFTMPDHFEWDPKALPYPPNSLLGYPATINHYRNNTQVQIPGALYGTTLPIHSLRMFEVTPDEAAAFIGQLNAVLASFPNKPDVTWIP